MNPSKYTVVASAVGLLLLLIASACQQSAQHRGQAMHGEATFKEYCATCHGPDAMGNGPLAAELEKEVPDLTQLSNKFDGVFPSEYVLRTIDGRQEFLAHGTRTMPIWGNIWRPGQEDSHEAEVEAQRTMNGLLHYLESIQAAPSATSSG